MERPRARVTWSWVLAVAGWPVLVLTGMGMRYGMAFYAFVVQGLVLSMAMFGTGLGLGIAALRRKQAGAVGAVILAGVGLLANLQLPMLMREVNSA